MSWFCKEVNFLLSQIKKGDKSKFNELYNFTVSFLRKIAYNYAIDKSKVEDILQEAFLKIFRNINQFDNKKDGYNWLCKIVQNTAYDKNKEFRKEAVVEDLPSMKIVNIEEDDIATKNDVDRAIEKLSKPDQELIYLYFYEGKTYQEIADIIGSKKSTVHFKINKCLKEIEKFL